MAKFKIYEKRSSHVRRRITKEYSMNQKRVLIVGGVAGGASCAARARRLSEKDEIIMFDRGEYVSFANCGLPYYVGNVIKKEENLLMATPEMFRKRFEIDVRLQSEVVAIDRENSRIQVKDLKTAETRYEPCRESTCPESFL
jgi:NADPH-dependent 2,4-dienoyl-CoA reductase/sulfur reductase-like enzyme